MMSGWERAAIDPSAGVRLAPRQERCPRCGIAKGTKGKARPGICVDCAYVLTRDERPAWAA